MGVPRFFRWLSERYPCIMEYIDPNTCPEFDNLYLDMNGVIHTCSHPSDDVHFRLPEDVIFRNIVSYVDYLFNMIAPKKVLFLSVDGVAPRSKMNQQRSRRYKSAKEAMDKEAKARANNEELPTTPRFDSNCITPGTEFMSKLHNYMLEEFAKRMQNNPSWKNVEVIYSGFDVPGEGEHKIMDYIRVCKANDKSQKEEIRHCLYGLDADLINLGLCSHEPFFSILREEVKFGRQNNKRRSGEANTTKFQLLHLSILRDYLDAEFAKLKTTLKKFEYSLENIIDDWILMNFLIGNDFLPHVPMFHVERGSLEILYKTYCKVLPTLDGYMNIKGEIQLERFNKFLDALAVQDLMIYKKNFIEMEGYADALNALTFGDSPPDSSDINSPDGETSSNELTDFEEIMDEEDLGSDEDMFISHKKCYYEEKLHFKEDLQAQVVGIANEYIRGLQWILFYYYRGCPSWNWFYPYYYSPYVSDLSKFDSESIKFTLSEPFPPLVQLLAVLPIPSKNFLPYVFQNLVGSEVSPLARFFPEKVDIDYNEKKQDYEAIVLIPFIEEDLIMATYKACKGGFNSSEQRRNALGHHHSLTYSDETVDSGGDLFKAKFPNVKFVDHLWNDFILDSSQILYGMRKNIDLNDINGFPTLKGVDYDTQLTHARLKVYDFPTKDMSIILHVRNRDFSDDELTSLSTKFCNQLVYINWPLIYEAKLVEVMTNTKRFFKDPTTKQITVQDNTKENWGYAIQGALSYAGKLNSQKGVHFEEPTYIVKVYKLQSQQFTIIRDKCVLEKKFAEKPTYLPLELLVYSEHSLKKPPPYKDLRTIFLPGKHYYLTGKNYYGLKSEVVEFIRDGQLGSVKVKIFMDSEPNFSSLNDDLVFQDNYYPENVFLRMAAKRFNISPNAAQKIISSIIVGINSKSRSARINLGLKFRFQQKAMPGYSYVEQYQGSIKYYFSKKCFDVIKLYHDTYPFVFEMIQNSKTFDQIDLETIHPHISIDEKKKIVLGIKDWLDKLEHFQLDHFPANVEYVDTTVVKEIEKCVHSHVSNEVIVLASLTPREFFIPEFVLRGDVSPDPRVKFRLYDRVVNVKKNCNVPFGEKGTVIGIYQKFELKEYSASEFSASDLNADDPSNTIIEVLFDNEVLGGISNRSSGPNVARMKAAWMINISFGMAMNKNSMQPIASLSQGKSPKTKFETSKKQQPTAGPSPTKEASPPTAAGDPSSLLKQIFNIGGSSILPAAPVASNSASDTPAEKSSVQVSNDAPKEALLFEKLKKLVIKDAEPEPLPILKQLEKLVKKDVAVKPSPAKSSTKKAPVKTKLPPKAEAILDSAPQSFPFQVPASAMNVQILEALNLKWSPDDEAPEQATAPAQPESSTSNPVIEDNNISKSVETTVSNMVVKTFKPKPPAEKKKDTAKTTASKPEAPKAKKDIKGPTNMFVPTSVQRKAVPKKKAEAPKTPPTSKSPNHLNHSLNSPFKSLTKRMDRVAVNETSPPKQMENVQANSDDTQSESQSGEKILNPFAKALGLNGVFADINIKTASQIKNESLEPSMNGTEVPPPPSFLPPPSWMKLN